MFGRKLGLTMALVSLVLVSALAAQTPTVKVSPLVGKKLPAVALVDFAGKPSTLSSHLGKPTFISFWASWCGPCLKEMPELQSILDKHPGEFQVLAIAMGDTLAAASAAMKPRAAFRFQWLLDPEATGAMSLSTKLGKTFNVIALPTAVWIASDGTVIDYWNGLPDGEGALTKKVEAFLAKSGK